MTLTRKNPCGAGFQACNAAKLHPSSTPENAPFARPRLRGASSVATGARDPRRVAALAAASSPHPPTKPRPDSAMPHTRRNYIINNQRAPRKAMRSQGVPPTRPGTAPRCRQINGVGDRCSPPTRRLWPNPAAPRSPPQPARRGLPFATTRINPAESALSIQYNGNHYIHNTGSSLANAPTGRNSLFQPPTLALTIFGRRHNPRNAKALAGPQKNQRAQPRDPK